MEERVYNLLFLCTHNSARSIIAETMLNHLGEGRFKAYSAGSHPSDGPNPMALKVLREGGLKTEGLHSKTWDVSAVPGAPVMDIVITVCDDAAGEPCPVWPGQPITAHWESRTRRRQWGRTSSARPPSCSRCVISATG